MAWEANGVATINELAADALAPLLAQALPAFSTQTSVDQGNIPSKVLRSYRTFPPRTNRSLPTGCSMLLSTTPATARQEVMLELCALGAPSHCPLGMYVIPAKDDVFSTSLLSPSRSSAVV